MSDKLLRMARSQWFFILYMLVHIVAGAALNLYFLEQLTALFNANQETVLQYGVGVTLGTLVIFPLIIQPWPQKRIWLLGIVIIPPLAGYIPNREHLAVAVPVSVYTLDLIAFIVFAFLVLLIERLIVPRYNGPKLPAEPQTIVTRIGVLALLVIYGLSRESISQNPDWKLEVVDSAVVLLFAVAGFALIYRQIKNAPDEYLEYISQLSLFAPYQDESEESDNEGHSN